ncbi:zinc ribbon domain-containing protein [bacterium]|nr:zinc ribbon domain-containing protein [bacterium]
MPTYDYECDACGHTYELFQKITEDPVKKCPECKKKKARRLFGTGAAIVFKGSGFYETDYRSDSYKKGAKDEKKKSESKPDTKSDSTKSDSKKSESKTDSKKSPKPDSKS